MWTLQELALGTEVLVLCGKASITWHSLALGVQCLREGLHHETSVTVFEDILAGSILHHNFLRWAVTTEAGLGGQRLPKPLSFCDVLTFIHTKEATDPKDKIFSLFGVFQALKMAVPKPDYSKSVNEIYAEAAQAAILHDRSPDILDCVVLYGHLQDAPSWVPDWNGKVMASIARQPFHTAKDSSSSYHFSSDGSRLTLSGIRVDDITMRGDPVLYPGGCEAAIKKNLNVLETFKSIKEWYQYVQHLHPYRTGQSAEEAFFRTLILDGAQSKGNTRDPERFRESFQQWFPLVMNCRIKPDNETASNQALLDPEKAMIQNNAAACFQCHVTFCLCGKAFFVTKTGYMGTSLEATKVGDTLVVFAGMKLPSVVRKEGNSYIFIGPAYVHAIMDGEAWEGRSASLEEFTII
jgi:hypothetical protein